MTMRVTLCFALLAPTAACGLTDLVPGGDAAPLPPLEALAVPKPSDPASNIAQQAVCADGADAITELETRVDALNAGVAADLALLRALYDASPTAQASISIYEVERDGRTLQVQIVDGGDELVITGTIVGSEDEEPLLSGAYAADGSEGAITLQGADGPVSSVWSEEDGGIEIVRTEGALSAAVDVDADTVQLVITDGAESVAAHWDRETGAGEIAVSNGTALCWSAGESVDEMCDVACAAP